ncbi:uncharacterized protein TNCT_549591, partial [Trichonephila clavata]
WQLLDKPLKLDEFNALPKVTPFFFEYNLRIRSRPQNPVVFRFQTELKLTAHKPTRYKYKLYSVEDRENGALNNYVFCQLKEDRLLGSFAICPPTEGMYYFKLFDSNGKEMDTRGIISREDSDTRISFTITPPRIGYYKFLIFGIPKPKLKGKWRLPLLASFLIDCKLTKNPSDDDPYNSNNKKETKKKKMRIPTVR